MSWTVYATKWSLIVGAFIFAIHAYLRSKKNAKMFENTSKPAGDVAYEEFVIHLSYGIGRYKTFRAKTDPGNRKYTEVGVMERINEVRASRLKLLKYCGDEVRKILIDSGTHWLDDIHSFGAIAPSVAENLEKSAHLDR